MATPNLSLSEDNIYARGYIIELPDGQSILKTDPLQYTPSANQDETHIMREGEELGDLAFKKYGNARWWHVLGYVNNILNPFEIPVGSKIVIPDIDVIKLTNV
jgi:nucleoid-associated protein YgaU